MIATIDTTLRLADFINIAAVLLSPLVAVAATLWWQERKERRARKDNLFVALMAHRRTTVPTIEMVNSLNLIDVVFSDDAAVVKHWHEYYQMLVSSKTQPEYDERSRKFIELLSAMAASLNYRKLSQIDIDKFYVPQAHVDQHVINEKIQREWLRVLENTASFQTEKKP